jgi:hypothetical protein
LIAAHFNIKMGAVCNMKAYAIKEVIDGRLKKRWMFFAK